MAPTKRAQVRIRSIHPNMLTSRRFSELSDRADVLFIRLQMCCDDEGRSLADCELLKAWLFPVRSRITPDAISEDLDELEAAGLVYLWADEGRALLEVAAWDEFQTPRRRYPSDYPPAPQNGRSEGRDGETPPGGARVAASSPANAAIGEGEGEGGNAVKRRRASALPRPFTVDADMRTWAQSLGADIEGQTSKFVDHYLANGQTRVDWQACWRKWIRGSVEGIR